LIIDRSAATRVVVTEYELPRVLLSAHDVSGDSKGKIWYSSHRTPYMGVLDPRTENPSMIAIGKDNFFLSGDGMLMPVRKDQSPPDLRYFKQTQR
jgi:streptogramin lyase